MRKSNHISLASTLLVLSSVLLTGCELFDFLDPFKEVVSFGEDGSSQGQFTRFRDMATSPDGITYVLDYTSTSVYIDPVDYLLHSFSKDGSFIKTVTVTGCTLDENERLMEDSSQTGSRIAFASDGTLFLLADIGNPNEVASVMPHLLKINPATGIVLAQWEPAFSESNSFHTMLVCGPADLLFTAGCRAINDDEETAQLFSYTTSGSAAAITPKWNSLNLTMFIENIAVDDSGRLYILYSNSYFIVDSTGKEIDNISLSYPALQPEYDGYEYSQYDDQGAVDIAVDNTGSVFVLCTYKHYDPANGNPKDIILYKFDSKGKLKGCWRNPLDLDDWTDLRAEPDGTILMRSSSGPIYRFDTTL